MKAVLNFDTGVEENPPLGKPRNDGRIVRNVSAPLCSFDMDKNPSIYSTIHPTGLFPLVFGYGDPKFPRGRNEFDRQLLVEARQRHWTSMQRTEDIEKKWLVDTLMDMAEGGSGGGSGGDQQAAAIVAAADFVESDHLPLSKTPDAKKRKKMKVPVRPHSACAITLLKNNNNNNNQGGGSGSDEEGDEEDGGDGVRPSGRRPLTSLNFSQFGTLAAAMSQSSMGSATPHNKNKKRLAHASVHSESSNVNNTTSNNMNRTAATPNGSRPSSRRSIVILSPSAYTPKKRDDAAVVVAAPTGADMIGYGSPLEDNAGYFSNTNTNVSAVTDNTHVLNGFYSTRRPPRHPGSSRSRLGGTEKSLYGGGGGGGGGGSNWTSVSALHNKRGRFAVNRPPSLVHHLSSTHSAASSNRSHHHTVNANNNLLFGHGERPKSCGESMGDANKDAAQPPAVLAHAALAPYEIFHDFTTTSALASTVSTQQRLQRSLGDSDDDGISVPSLVQTSALSVHTESPHSHKGQPHLLSRPDSGVSSNNVERVFLTDIENGSHQVYSLRALESQERLAALVRASTLFQNK